MISTYAGVQTAIADELHRSDLTSYIPDFIQRCESKLNAKLRIRQMETTMSTVVASGVIAIPSNYIELKSAYVTSVTPYVHLDRKTAEWIYQQYPDRSGGDTPSFIAREGSNFIFGPNASDSVTVKFVYYNRFLPLASATNAIFLAYPGLWLYGALLEAEGFLKNDKRIGIWAAHYKQMIELIQDESNAENFSGGPLAMTPG